MSKYAVLLAGAFVAAAWAPGSVSAPEEEGHVQTLAVTPGGQLELKTQQGDVEVRLTDRSELVIRTSGLDPADLRIEQTGDLVQIAAGKGDWGWGDVEIEIEAPSRFNLNLRTGGGDISVKGTLEGMLAADTAGGDIEFEDIRGEAAIKTLGGDIEGGAVAGNAQIRTHGGDIEMGQIGGDLDVDTYGGDVEIAGVGASLKARSMGGDVEIGEVGGSAEVFTMGGDIMLPIVGAGADLETAGGDISLEGARGHVRADTAGGDVQLRGVVGSVEAQSAGGDVEVELQPQGERRSEISSKGGNLTLSLPAGARARVEALLRQTGSWWHREGDDENQIVSDFPHQTFEKDERGNIKAAYEINGGGPVIRLETVHGDIRILRGSSQRY